MNSRWVKNIIHWLLNIVHIIPNRFFFSWSLFFKLCIHETNFWGCFFFFLIRETTGIFIIKGFQTIVFIFIVISTMFWPICPLAFFRCLLNSATDTELWTTSFIESAGVACSDSGRTHSVTILGVGFLSFSGDNHVEVAGSILTAGE